MKNNIIIFSLFLFIFSFAQNSKKLELLKEMNKLKFPFKELILDKGLSKVAKDFSNVYTMEFTPQDQANYFHELTPQQKYAVYCIILPEGYNNKEMIDFFNREYPNFINAIAQKKIVGIFANQTKCIIVFPFDGSVYAKD